MTPMKPKTKRTEERVNAMIEDMLRHFASNKTATRVEVKRKDMLDFFNKNRDKNHYPCLGYITVGKVFKTRRGHYLITNEEDPKAAVEDYMKSFKEAEKVLSEDEKNDPKAFLKAVEKSQAKKKAARKVKAKTTKKKTAATKKTATSK